MIIMLFWNILDMLILLTWTDVCFLQVIENFLLEFLGVLSPKLFEEFLKYYLWISIIIFILKSWLRFRANTALLRLFVIWHLNAWQDVSLLSLLWFEDCVHCVHCVFWRDLNNEILFSFRLDYDKFCRLRWRCHWHLLPASLLEKWFH